MLIPTRSVGRTVIIGDSMKVKFVAFARRNIRIGIEVPNGMEITRVAVIEQSISEKI